MKIEYILNNMFIETEEDLEFVNKVTNNVHLYKIGDYVNLAALGCGGCNVLNEENLERDGLKKREYVVKPLDTIKTICNKLNIEEAKLKKNLDGQNLFIGKKIFY